MNTQDQIIEFLKVIGPTLPAKVAKNIKSEIIIASAHLSDLAAQGLVKISSLKVGGSPLYYLPGQEAQLYPFAAGNINPKDLQVLERLKEEKVLQEASLDLLSKVALRSLRDFAVPLHVYIDGQRQLFWKWHLLLPEGTNDAIASLLRRNELFSTPKAAETVNADAPSSRHQEIEKYPDELINESVAATEDFTTVSLVQKAISLEKEQISPKDEIQQKLNHSKKHDKKEIKKATPLDEKSSDIKKAEEIKKEEKTVVAKTEKLEKSVAVAKSEDKKLLITKVKTKAPSDTFFPSIDTLFRTLEITVEKKEVVRKNAEINFAVDIPSVVGKMRYFCKAKHKMKCDEKDLSSAYVEAQMKKLPLLFLYSNQLTKKAQAMINSGAFENLIVRKME